MGIPSSMNKKNNNNDRKLIRVVSSTRPFNNNNHDDTTTITKKEKERLLENDNSGSSSSRISDIYNKTSNTIGDVKDTIHTAPVSWTRSQWYIISIIVGCSLVLFGCIYRCI